MNVKSKNNLCMQLRYKNLITLTAGQTGMLSITCKKGKLWITLKGSARDFVLGPGETMDILPGQPALIEALDDATFALADLRKGKAA